MAQPSCRPMTSSCSGSPANRDGSAGPHRGEHAGSGNLEAHFSELAGDFRYEVMLHRGFKHSLVHVVAAPHYGLACDACTALRLVPAAAVQLLLVAPVAPPAVLPFKFTK